MSRTHESSLNLDLPSADACPERSAHQGSTDANHPNSDQGAPPLDTLKSLDAGQSPGRTPFDDALRSLDMPPIAAEIATRIYLTYLAQGFTAVPPLCLADAANLGSRVPRLPVARNARAWLLNPEDPIPIWVLTSNKNPTASALRTFARSCALTSPRYAAMAIQISSSSKTVGICCSDLATDDDPLWIGTRDSASSRLHALWTVPAVPHVAPPHRTRSVGAHIVEFTRLYQRRQALCDDFFLAYARALRSSEKRWTLLDNDCQATRTDLSLTLLSRLLFLYFVQQKQWLNNDSKFLGRLLLHPDQRNLFQERLVPLFFDVLNTPPNERTCGSEFTNIPFLNGGLFTRTSVEQDNPNATIDDESIREIMLTVFDPFPFTEVEAPHSSDASLAIDPHMLGQVFERLMSATDRKQSGAFYTPPTLVRESVDAAIQTLLVERLGRDLYQNLFDQRPMSTSDAVVALKSIDNLRILDPAVGSGAFLLGTLESLARLRAHALSWATPHTPPSPQDAERLSRQHIIQFCLHGIDISPTATSLCQLRLWLALAATQPNGTANEISPLPNLSHRICTGDALVSPTAAANNASLYPTRTTSLLRSCHVALSGATGHAKQRLLQTRSELTRKLAIELSESSLNATRERLRTHNEYLQHPDLFGQPRKRTRADTRHLDDLKTQVDAAENHLASIRRTGWATSFDPHLHFSDTLSLGGFDLIVGNPPWIRLSELSATKRKTLRDLYPSLASPTLTSAAYGAQPDISVAFLERSLHWLAPDGVVSFIIPAKLFTTHYAARIRDRLLQTTSVRHVHDYSRDAVSYFNAAAYPGLIIAQANDDEAFNGNQPRTIVGPPSAPYFSTPQSLLPAHRQRTSSAWPLLHPKTLEITQRISANFPPLSKLLHPRLGAKTGLNKAFLNPDLPAELTTPMVRGASFRNWPKPTPIERILLCHDHTTARAFQHIHPEIQSWLDPFVHQLRSRSDCRADTHPWELFRLAPASLGHRVVWRDIHTHLQAHYLCPIAECGPVAINTLYSVALPSREAAIRTTAWLNTWIVRHIAACGADPALGNYRRFMAKNVGSVPLPSCILNPNGHLSRRFSALAHAIYCPNDEPIPETSADFEELNIIAARILQVTGSEYAHLTRESRA